MAGGRRKTRSSNTADALYDADSLETSSQDSLESHSSTASRGRKLDEGGDSPIHLQDKLSSAMDALTEKRATTREGGLHTICTILTFKYVPELLAPQIVTLIEGVKKSVARSGAEGELAARSLALASLTLGSDTGVFALFPLMRELALDPSFAISNKVVILEALSAILLMLDQHPHDSLEWLSFAESLFCEKEDASIVKAALNLWGVLATEISFQYMQDTMNSYIAAHEKLLTHDSTDVRIAAGENIGILFEMMGHENEQYDNRAALIEKLADIAADASRHRGKKDTRSQRMIFKELLATVENANTPTHHLTIRKMHYSLKSWASLKRLSLIKYYLNEGLSAHLENNEVVQSCLSLEVPPEAPERPTVQDKRVQQLIQHKVDKARSKNLSVDRDRRSTSRQSLHVGTNRY
ncbi:hypothetical protein SeMB42_g02310 [Synchytrium endobioticum]|uniref:Interferon-related developmental regulator N-terminal domain-containing protein n=1 Tax=Synchytrium endobioticum TaxID=286115 RepID=A0A507CV10_9FUNG|nr:hypothetical protein SeLEV6574_g05314 [Synchytrium endobioticum]TPX50318.1 hypothetical protein SeMB42_g02310 [Synchytrium endobioticum]